MAVVLEQITVGSTSTWFLIPTPSLLSYPENVALSKMVYLLRVEVASTSLAENIMDVHVFAHAYRQTCYSNRLSILDDLIPRINRSKRKLVA